MGSIGDLREDEIRNYFTQFGTIDEIQMESAKSQAFITFADHDPVDRCVTQKHTVKILKLKSKKKTFIILLLNCFLTCNLTLQTTLRVL